MIKIYQAILDKQLNTTVIVDGREVRLNFSGGEREFNGVCIVADEPTQKAIEASGSFNKLFRLRETIPATKSGLKGPGVLIDKALNSEDYKENNLLKGSENPVVKPITPVVPIVPVVPVEEVKEVVPIVPVEEVKEVAPIVPVEEVKEVVETKTSFEFRNINEAQAMLTVAPYNVAVAKIRTLANIQAMAKELGIVIEFKR